MCACFVEPFADTPMWSLESLEARVAAGEALPVLPADRAVAHLPALRLSEPEALALRQGRAVAAADASGEPADRLWRLYCGAAFLGLGVTDAHGELRVRRLFPEPLQVPGGEGP